MKDFVFCEIMSQGDSTNCWLLEIVGTSAKTKRYYCLQFYKQKLDLLGIRSIGSLIEYIDKNNYSLRIASDVEKSILLQFLKKSFTAKNLGKHIKLGDTFDITDNSVEITATAPFVYNKLDNFYRISEYDYNLIAQEYEDTPKKRRTK